MTARRFLWSVASLTTLSRQHAFPVDGRGVLSRALQSTVVRPVLDKKTTAEEVADIYSADLTGRVAVVTGGNSGIGLETARVFAKRGCKVIVCSRSLAAGREAVAGIGAPFDTVIQELDLADLESVKTAAKEIEELVGGPSAKIDFLVLNAGIMALPDRELTPQGFEKQIGVNHFGHHYLYTQLEHLVNQPGCRTVVLSSTAHSFGSIDLEDLHFSNGREYSPWGAYGQSKAANLVFAKAVSDRLEGSGASCFSVHPGVIRTNLWREQQGPAVINSIFARIPFVPDLNELLPRLISDKSIEQGAATTLYACLAPGLPLSYPGAYLSDCDVGEIKVAALKEPELRKRLWKITENQINAALDH